MSILKVARMGHPVLRARAKPVDPSQIRSPKFQTLLDDMFETMKEYQGVGLAAPQVHESLRVFVCGYAPPVDAEDDDPVAEEDKVPLLALINPEIALIGRETVEDWEGCLSIPDIRGLVTRARHIAIRAYDRHGKRLELRVSGFPARVMQHETDHLDGVLFLDRMNSFESLTFLDEFSRYWTKQEVPAE